MQWKFDMVIHGEYGGFGLTSAIVDLLRERGCTWVDECARGSDPNRWYISAEVERDESFRKDPIFVQVVRELTERIEREGDTLVSWKDRRQLEQDLLGGLRVVSVTVEVEIDDHDGRETVRVVGGVW